MKRFYSFFILLVACLMTVSVQAAQSLPFSYDFEDQDLSVTGWTSLNESSANDGEFGIDANAKHGGDYGFRFSSFTRDYTSYDQYLFSPELDAENGVIVQFYYAASSASGTEKFKVGYSTTDADLASFTWGNEISTNKTTWAQTDELSFPAGTKYVAIHYYSNYQYRLYVDDFTFSAPAACPPLASISISNLSRRSMTVNLNTKPGVDLGSYELVYADKEIEIEDLDGYEEKITVNNATYNLTGLERETTYHIYVRANCGEDGTSDWVSAVATTKGLSDCDEIPVGDGTSSEYGPICGYYGYERNGYIFTPADGLSAGSISKIAWNYTGAATIPAKIYIKNTDATAFESTLVWNQLIADATLVYDASITLKAGWNEFTFSAPFDYTGGNLMVLVASNYGGTGGGSASAFYSTSSNSDSHFYIRKDNSIDDDAEYSNSMFSTKGINNHRHDIKFTSCYSSVACPTVTDLASELLNAGTTEARISWTASGADYLSGYQIVRSESEISDWSGITLEDLEADVTSKEYSDLEASHHYYVYVRAICQAEGKDEGNSEWESIDFTTNADCPAVLNLAAELTGNNTVLVSWDPAYAEQDKKFLYAVTETELVNEPSADLVEDTTRIELALDNDKHYYIYVASKCGESRSDYKMVEINTLPACQAVENITVVRTTHNLVELSWESAQFATETQWEVGIVGDEANAQIVDERHAKLFGLDPETEYQAYVKAKCSDTESSDAAVSASFTTEETPGNCKQVGNGTNSGYGAFCGYYGYERHGYIYTVADGLSQTGKILSIALNGKAAKNIPAKVYVKLTSETTFDASKSWNELISSATKVLDETVATTNGWFDVDITDFDYTGGNLMILFESSVTGSGGSAVEYYYTSSSNSKAHIYSRADGSYDDDAAMSSVGSSKYGEDAKLVNIKFCFEEKDCPDVSALTASDITTSEATISWEPIGKEKAWNVFVTADEVTDFSDLSGYDVEEVNGLSKKFINLDDDQDYFAYVQPVCDGADYSVLPFRTIASCKAMISPAVVSETITAHTARVTWVDPNPLKAGQYTVAYAKKDIFDINDSESYLTINATDTFADLSGLQQDTIYRFAVMANCGGSDPSRYSVAASLTTLESCFNPTAPAVLESSIKAHEATVYWKDTHDDAGYIVAYGLYDGFDINNPATYQTVSVLADTFVVLDQLLAATKYAFKVKGDCSSVGEGMSNGWTYTQDFTTGCEAQAVPYTEGFEKSDALFCWTVGNVQSTSSSYIPYRSSSAAATDSYGLYMYAYRYNNSTKADSAYAVLPELDFGTDGIAAYQIRFNAKSYIPYSGTYYQHISVCIAEDNNLTNMELIKDIEVTGEFAEYEISFADYAGAGNRIVLLVVVDPESTANSRTAQIYVDDIYVSRPAACKRVASINEPTDITTTSAKVTWIPDGDESDFQYIVVLAGEEPDWSAAKDITGTAADLDELNPSTAYDFYVRTDCGSEQSEPRSISFRTECDVVVVDANNEFFEDFDASDALACWEAPIENISSTDRQWVLSTSQHYSGSASVYSGFYGPIYVITPEIAIANEANRNVELTFWSYNSYISDYDKNSVVVMGETEVELWSPGSVVDSWEEATISLNDYKGKTIRLGFKYEGNNAHGWYVDDVRIAFGPEDPTAIGNAGIEVKAIKRLENGVLVIELNGIKYNAQGALISK